MFRTVTPKNLLLELLVAAGDAPLPVRTAVAACGLFDITENSVRVALVRLSSAGLIESAGRGEYRLAERAQGLAREVASWRDVEQRVCRWGGGYVAVHSGELGRSDKSALRRRTRALALVGLAEIARGLHVRPDNLRGGVGSVRERLHGLGLEPEALVFSATAFDAEREARIRQAWDGKALTASYARTRQKIERWLARAPALELDVAARESFLLGGQAIRQIVYDPLLPTPLVGVDERRTFVEATKEIDRVGRRIWKRFFQLAAEEGSRAARPTNGRESDGSAYAWTS
jgi:phenylacetic acid degradation operon negative regulatory protein